jgi:hypothetical protein
LQEPSDAPEDDRAEVEGVQPDDGPALVVGRLDAVPETTHGQAMKVVNAVEFGDQSPTA